MARITVCAVGTWGDALPLLALGVELSRRGHEVRAAANPEFLPWVRALGLSARSCGPRFGPREARKHATDSSPESHILGGRVKAASVLSALPEQYEDLLAATRGADLLVSHSLRHGALPVQRRRGLLWAAVSHQPGQYWLRDQPYVLSLAPRASLNLLSFSPAFARPHPSAHPGARPTGFLFFEGAALPGWQPSPELRSFVEESRGLLLLCLGCAPWPSVGRMIREVGRAAAELGLRLLVQPGWNSPGPRELSWIRRQPHVRLAGPLPHSWLFAHAAAVIHAGSIGLCARAWRHGVPMLLLPSRLDHCVNARRVLRTGTGVAMDRTCINSDTTAHLLSEKVLAGGCRRASVWAQRRLRLEDGLAAACTAIERLLKRARRPRVPLRNRFCFAPSVLRSYGTFGGVGKSVSFIVPCMGRLLHLQRTVRSVLAQPDSEYILVDWSCPEHSGDWVAKRFPEARVVRVPGKDRFHVSAARNLGAQAARKEWLAFVDADLILSREFLADARRLMRPGAFLVFPKTTPGYAGMLICRTSDFQMAGRYHEEMTDYGMEDMDLRERLSWLGLWQLYLSQSLARHIRHGDPKRVGFFAEKDKRKSERRNDLRGRANRLAALGLH